MPKICLYVGIYLVNTWYISGIYQVYVYTWYIPGIYLVYDNMGDIGGMCHKKTSMGLFCTSHVTTLTWYIPGTCWAYTGTTDPQGVQVWGFQERLGDRASPKVFSWGTMIGISVVYTEYKLQKQVFQINTDLFLSLGCSLPVLTCVDVYPFFWDLVAASYTLKIRINSKFVWIYVYT